MCYINGNAVFPYMQDQNILGSWASKSVPVKTASLEQSSGIIVIVVWSLFL